MRQFVLHNKVTVHPSRSAFEVSIQSGHLFGIVDGRINADIDEIVT